MQKLATYSRKRKRPTFQPSSNSDSENDPSNTKPDSTTQHQSTASPLQSQPKSTFPPSKPPSKKAKPTLPLKQTTLSLGQRIPPSCPTCHMHFNLQTPSDVAAHARFHRAFLARFDVPPALLKDARVKHERVQRRRLASATQAADKGVEQGLDDGDAILRIGADASGASRAFARRMLEEAEGEMGALSSGDVWALRNDKAKSRSESKSGTKQRGAIRDADIALPTPPGSSSPVHAGLGLGMEQENSHEDDHEDEHEAHRDHKPRPGCVILLYTQSTRVVGVLLAERISRARPTELIPSREPLHPLSNSNTSAAQPSDDTKQDEPTNSSRQQQQQQQKPLSTADFALSRTTRPAKLGISRVWTAESARGCGVARVLLDAACGWADIDVDFLVDGDDGDEKRREAKARCVAFSAPTDAGARLAAGWTGRGVGWMVYGEGNVL